jgi:hypothetical protein
MSGDKPVFPIALWVVLGFIIFTFMFLSLISAFVPATEGNVYATAVWLITFLLFLVASFIVLGMVSKLMGK